MVVVLPQDDVVAYLAAAQSLEIKPPPDETLVFRRKLLTKQLGFLDQDLLFHLRDVRTLPARYVGRSVICSTREINPHLPACPGEPGLMCSVRQAMVDGAPWSVFLRRERKVNNKAVWFYAGEYVFGLVGAMTAAQFNNQSDVVCRLISIPRRV